MKVEETTLHVSTKTHGTLGVCVDPQPLNVALKRRHYPFPDIEGVLPDLETVEVFTKADLKGFLHCELDKSLHF